ncbi:unnamed protein product [Amoebophrya sp. A25]|nr:unnamed protein product [Amoebophrya sp. A25]|eukprot:GSA25T00023975001.1
MFANRLPASSLCNVAGSATNVAGSTGRSATMLRRTPSMPSTSSAISNHNALLSELPLRSSLSNKGHLPELQLQRRSFANRAMHVPKLFGQVMREVKTQYPPRRRSKVFRLPIHSKLCCVTKGHFYPPKPIRAPGTLTPILLFSKAHTHRQLDSLTEQECYKLVELLPEILKEFERAEKQKDEVEAEDHKRCFLWP